MEKTKLVFTADCNRYVSRLPSLFSLTIRFPTVWPLRLMMYCKLRSCEKTVYAVAVRNNIKMTRAVKLRLCVWINIFPGCIFRYTSGKIKEDIITISLNEATIFQWLDKSFIKAGCLLHYRIIAPISIWAFEKVNLRS